MNATLVRISKRLSFYKKDKDTRSFVAHNQKNFDALPAIAKGGPEILFELHQIAATHIASSYVANVLAKKHGARIRAYIPYGSFGWLRRLSNQLSKFFSVNEYGVYKSFGVSDFIVTNLTKAQRDQALKIVGQISERLKSKRDIEDITVDGVWLGDFIYDSFLRNFHKPTIDLTSSDFRSLLITAIEAYVFWVDYFNTHDVRAIHVSHTGYIHAIPMRIAINRGIDAYQINATHAYKLDKHLITAYSDFFRYHEDFLKLPVDIQKNGIEEAKRRIELRFTGKVGIDMPYSTETAFGKFKQERVLKESPNIKILIATHCFFDSPHGYGKGLFPDFYEWLEFLGRVSEKTNYDWYIKTHPNYWPGTMETIVSIIENYPRLTLLPADSSHHQIIDEGINFALTCHGTIGFEYAALGLPVINAAVNNPHISYEFNAHPQSVKEYEEILLNLDSFEIDINKEDIYEHYFMSRLLNPDNWLFPDYARAVKEAGGPNYVGTPAMYRQWLNEWNKEQHDVIVERLNNFVESGVYRLSTSHPSEPAEKKIA